jgi:hypothetical protein
MRRMKRYQMGAEQELIYLISAPFDRKSRERSTAGIIERSRHPFFEKTDAVLILMGTHEMESTQYTMETDDVVEF